MICCVLSVGLGQHDDTTQHRETVYNIQLNETEVHFLYSYYEQDGDHSPVLGGMGTEYLTDHVGKIIVTIPSKKHSFGFAAGIDHYTSASTDNINPQSVSSASVVDDRIYFSADYGRQHAGTTWGIHLGYSTEWDVKSYQAGFSISKELDNNQQVFVQFQHFSDRWELIFPVELRPFLPIDSSAWRRVYNPSLTYSFVIHKKMQASLSAELVWQSGLLSTPFHRVYFKDVFYPAVERLPSRRIKVPLGWRINYYALDELVVRTSGRFYWDNFGIRATTLSAEAAIKPSAFVSLLPFYRFHWQSASRYFAPIDTHTSDQAYYTSDCDLSGFTSHKLGIGLRYSPLRGIWENAFGAKKRHHVRWKKIELRGAVYQRSDGLRAWIMSLGAFFSFQKN